MSNRYEAAISVAAAPAAGAAFAELRNTSARRILVEEVTVSLGAATATGLGVIRATAQGVGGASSTLGQAEDPNAPTGAASLFASAFTTAPTFGALWMKRVTIGAAVGNLAGWTWPQSDRLIIPPSGSLVLVNIAAAAGAAAIHVNAVWTE